MSQTIRSVAVVTGAVGNLGEAVVRRLAEGGARVVLVDRSQQRLEDKYAELAAQGDHLLAGDVDLTDAASVAGLFERVDARYGRVDVLVNTVGGFRCGAAIHETDPEDWDFLFRLNVRTALLTCREAVRRMISQGSGRIVNVASEAALSGTANFAAYSVAKTGVLRLTEALAGETSSHGLRVNCVLPGTMDTPANRGAMPDADPAKWVTLDEVASVVEFLCSAAAGGVTGVGLPIRGEG